MAGNGLNVSISQIFFREKKSPQILQCFFVLGAKSFAKFAMVFRPRNNNGQIPCDRHNLHWKLQPRPLLSEFFKDLIVMCHSKDVCEGEKKISSPEG